MAIFLTVGMLEVLLRGMEPGPDLLRLFALQMSAGAATGLAIGWAGAWVIDRINLPAAGLYPILVSTMGLLAYGSAASVGGSGFLSIYIAGIVIGNREVVFLRGIRLFHDAAAWLSQIAMFVVLGLLSFPNRLVEVAPQALGIALILIFVARPLAVVVCLLPFRYAFREVAFLSWVGLKGAVPITLATFPLLLGLPAGALLFDVVFFVVLVSALAHGATIPLFARRLGLQLPPEPEPPVTLEITSLKHVDGGIVEYTVGPESRAAGRPIQELALPDGVVVALITRGQHLIPPHGSTRVAVGDHLFVVLRSETRALVDRVFSRDDRLREDRLPVLEFPLRGTTTVAELEEFYGITLNAPADHTLATLLREYLGTQGTVRGRRAMVGEVALTVRELDERGAIEQVGLIILPSPDEAGDGLSHA
jgi:potassium/hydrogen antiporter